MSCYHTRWDLGFLRWKTRVANPEKVLRWRRPRIMMWFKGLNIDHWALTAIFQAGVVYLFEEAGKTVLVFKVWYSDRVCNTLDETCKARQNLSRLQGVSVILLWEQNLSDPNKLCHSCRLCRICELCLREIGFQVRVWRDLKIGLSKVGRLECLEQVRSQVDQSHLMW